MQKKVKVFHIIHALKIGGVEKAALSSLENLNSFYDFRLLIIDENRFDIQIPTSQRQYVVSFHGKHPFDLVNYFRLVLYIKKEKPYIIISSLWRSVITTMLVKLVYNDFIWVSFYHNTVFKHLLDKIFNKFAFSWSKYILVDSEKAKVFVKKWVPNNKVTVISFLTQKSHNYYDRDFTNLRMVYIGRINPIKGIDIGLQLQHYLWHRHNIKLSFDIYGPDEGALKGLEILANKLQIENFKYCGVLLPNEVSQTLLKYELFFHASKYEGMAMSVVEALQHGLVSIVKPVGEIDNYTQHLISAIHIHDVNINDSFYNFEEIAILIQNKVLLKLISDKAQKTFDSYSSYSESLLDFLQKI